ncbi:hypothetical protein AURDEDRAFT_152957 [Auricularia subglabra TFB-10046 SS5]|nr:hypothetical protein AURDEDRAFT_152957 [Auricularia subglabra TFB-10046 SS5]
MSTLSLNCAQRCPLTASLRFPILQSALQSPLNTLCEPSGFAMRRIFLCTPYTHPRMTSLSYAFPEDRPGEPLSPYNPPETMPPLFAAVEASLAGYLANPIAGVDRGTRTVYAMARSHGADILPPPPPPRDSGALEEYGRSAREYLDAAVARIPVATAPPALPDPGVAILATTCVSPSARKRKLSQTDLAADGSAPAPKRRKLVTLESAHVLLQGYVCGRSDVVSRCIDVPAPTPIAHLVAAVASRETIKRQKRAMRRGMDLARRLRGSEDVGPHYSTGGPAGTYPLGDDISKGSGLPAQSTLQLHNSSDISDDAQRRFAEA